MLTLNLITRGRFHILEETIDRTLANIAEKSTKYVISVDDDDTDSIAEAQKFSKNCTVLVRPREDTLGEKIDRALLVPNKVYLTQVDYAPILTKGFDTRLIEAADRFPDNIGYIHSHLANLSFPSLIAVTHGAAEATGNLGPPYFPFWFWDHWSDDLARMTGRVTYVDMQVDHHSRRPNTTMEMRDLVFWASFYDIMYKEREAEARAILEKMSAPLWQKNLMVSQWPLVHQRSCIINNMVRNDAENYEKGRNAQPPNERYLRIKAKAEKILQDKYKAAA